MNRMHPEDLRALVVAILHSSREAAGCTWDFSIRSANGLLAELARTAKPEPTLPTGCHRSHPHEDDPECPGNLAFMHGKAQGAKKERERIIALLANDPHSTVCSLVVKDHPPVSEATIRFILEPKP